MQLMLMMLACRVLLIKSWAADFHGASLRRCLGKKVGQLMLMMLACGVLLTKAGLMLMMLACGVFLWQNVGS